jgi:hypothetical protein
MDIASHAVRTMRQELHRQNQAVQAMEVQPTSRAFAHQVSYQSGWGRGNSSIVPPSYIFGPIIQPQRMYIVQQNDNLQMPVCPQNKRR